MHLAFPAAARPDLDLTGLIGLASDLGLALELPAGRDPRQSVATNLFFADPAAVGRRLADAGVPLAAVWLAVPAGPPQATAAEVARAADVAAAAGCRRVRLVEARPVPPAALRAAGNAAAAAGVQLAVDNPPLRHGVVDCWRRLDAVDHPSVGCCLDTLNAALGGDGPSLAVPTLASRLALVRLRRPATDAETVHRLAGIGYDGVLSIDPAAVATVRTWLPKAVAVRP